MRRVCPIVGLLATPFALLDAAPAGCPAPPHSSARFSVGLNLAGVTDYSAEPVFVDLFKAARAWVGNADGKPWGRGGPLDLDAGGNVKSLAPGQFADAVVLADCPEVVAGGPHVCLYDGDGDLDFRMDAKVTKRTPGRLEVAIEPRANAVHLRLSRTDPANPVRNIRLVPAEREGDYREKPFRDDFLARWKGVGTLRFMDWQRTNDSKAAAWADRPTPADHSQALKGVAVEYVVRLANALDADPWVCLPHLATDEYVREFARYTKKHLKPGRRVYVEYSNECWNGQFAQARYCKEEGKRLTLSGNDFEAQLRFYSRRSVEVFAAWEAGFGKENRVRVLAAQGANPWTGRQVMDWDGAAGHADAIAVAPYFGNKWGSPKTAAEVAKMTPAALAAALKEDVAASLKDVRAYAREAKARKLALVAYEAGQHLAGTGGAENDAALTKLFIDTNREPAMKGLYVDYVNGWREAGGGLLCVFSSVNRPSKWGSWGLLEYAGQDPAAAPKYRAFREVLDAAGKK